MDNQLLILSLLIKKTPIEERESVLVQAKLSVDDIVNIFKKNDFDTQDLQNSILSFDKDSHFWNQFKINNVLSTLCSTIKYSDEEITYNHPLFMLFSKINKTFRKEVNFEHFLSSQYNHKKLNTDSMFMDEFIKNIKSYTEQDKVKWGNDKEGVKFLLTHIAGAKYQSQKNARTIFLLLEENKFFNKNVLQSLYKNYFVKSLLTSGDLKQNISLMLQTNFFKDCLIMIEKYELDANFIFSYANRKIIKKFNNNEQNDQKYIMENWETMSNSFQKYENYINVSNLHWFYGICFPNIREKMYFQIEGSKFIEELNQFLQSYEKVIFNEDFNQKFKVMEYILESYEKYSFDLIETPDEFRFSLIKQYKDFYFKNQNQQIFDGMANLIIKTYPGIFNQEKSIIENSHLVLLELKKLEEISNLSEKESGLFKLKSSILPNKNKLIL